MMLNQQGKRLITNAVRPQMTLRQEYANSLGAMIETSNFLNLVEILIL